MAGVIRDAVGKECPSRTGLARVGGNGQMAGWRVSGRRPPSVWEWKGSQSSQGATELVFPGPALGKMQSEAARRAVLARPSHQHVAGSGGNGQQPFCHGLFLASLGASHFAPLGFFKQQAGVMPGPAGLGLDDLLAETSPA